MKEFNISNDTMVVTSSYITEDGHAILEISHEDDEEGGSLWQFHSGNGDFSMEKMQLVRLDTIIGIDDTVLGVAGLKMGSVAKRISRGSPWIIQ
jgi:hypothetical protein